MINTIVTTGIILCVILLLIVICLKIYVFVKLRGDRLKSALDLYNITWKAARIGPFKTMDLRERGLVKIINLLITATVILAILTVATGLFFR